MKKLSLLLGVVLVLLLGLAVYFYVGGTLSARPSVHTASAADYPEAYGTIRALVASGAVTQLFDAAPLPESPEGYALVDVTIDLYNRGLFAAEWLDIRAEAAPGDIAVYSLTGEGGDIDARGSGQVNLKLITAGAPDAPRRYSIEYYIYGMKRTIRVGG